jgi:hypothetical protein
MRRGGHLPLRLRRLRRWGAGSETQSVDLPDDRIAAYAAPKAIRDLACRVTFLPKALQQFDLL